MEAIQTDQDPRPTMLGVIAAAVGGGIALSLASIPFALSLFGFIVDGIETQSRVFSIIVFVTGAGLGGFAAAKRKRIILWVLIAAGIAGVVAGSIMFRY